MKTLLVLLLTLVAGTSANAQKQHPLRKLQLAEMAISQLYVDSVNQQKLVEDAIRGMLKELDPHSSYSTAKETKALNEPLNGSFDGIGIQFNMVEDTLLVIQPVSKGPSEKVGILAGDRIITVADTTISGVKMERSEIMRRLRGPRGSKIKLGIKRRGVNELLYFTVTRGKIPVYSVDAYYMIRPHLGYIRIGSFGATTYGEFMKAVDSLQTDGMRDLIIDLQDNGGGYLQASVKIIEEFLQKNDLIVYTEGRAQRRMEYRAPGNGRFTKGKVYVLVNEYTASAAEILSGAMQDQDRGTIIGRRSFGKGLVQQQLGFPDGSMIRLTIARYYTPSGRCIQKPFVAGDNKDYEEDILARYQHGEFFSQDSIKHHGPAYHTSIGRTVYGGGGITPDIFIPEDTLGMTSYYKAAAMTGLILQFAYTYTDNNRLKLNNFHEMMDMVKYLDTQNLVDKFATYADKNGLKRRNLMIRKSYNLLNRYLNSRVIYNMLDEQALTQYLNLDDPTVTTALQVFKNKAAFPKKPIKKNKK